MTSATVIPHCADAGFVLVPVPPPVDDPVIAAATSDSTVVVEVHQVRWIFICICVFICGILNNIGPGVVRCSVGCI